MTAEETSIATAPIQFLICPIGTAGDILPFVGIGVGLKRRGYDVTLIAHSYAGPLIESYGLDFVDLNDRDAFRAAHDHPDMWHVHKGPARGVQFYLRHNFRQQFAEIERRRKPGQTILLGPGASFAARVAHDKFSLPLVTAIFCPFLVRSALAPPAFPGIPMPLRLPAWFWRAAYWVADKTLADPQVAPELNRFRAELGLPPVQRFMNEWYYSPQLTLGLFPDWFAHPQPDWPQQVRLTGFPLFDGKENEPVPPAVDEFLTAGEPPIVFTPGTGMANGRPFFDAALEACRLLKRRGLFLSRFADQVPPNLPPEVRHVDYLPFSQVFPRSAALVSHGGIGTVAQALRAGIPQLVMPLTFDQPDNAARLKKLGVGRSLPPRRFLGPAVARELAALLGDPAVAEQCRKLAARFPPADPVAATCAALDEFAGRHATSELRPVNP